MKLFIAALLLVACCVASSATAADQGTRLEAALPGIEATLVETHGEAQRERIRLGLRQAADLWRD